uniref:Uncharacterized protein n=1 Tax=Romanomermis culicivorax TaxID=13658 RepID=A0A915J270_ROMCU
MATDLISLTSGNSSATYLSNQKPCHTSSDSVGRQSDRAEILLQSGVGRRRLTPDCNFDRINSASDSSLLVMKLMD